MSAVSLLARAAIPIVVLVVLVASAVPVRAESAATNDGARAVELARKRVAAGDLAFGTRELAAFVDTHPGDIASARYLGDLIYRQGDPAGAERTYRSILRYAPHDPETHDRLGGIYAASDRVNEAIAEFTASLPIGTAYAHLVDLHRRLGDLAAFEVPFRRDADDRPNDPGAQYALGAVYRAERRSAGAATYLERALALEPRACATLAELGSVYIDLERVGEAIAMFERCLAIDRTNYAALVNLADAYIVQERFALARTTLDGALRVSPDGPEALVDAGYLADVAGDWQAAVADYLHAIAVDPLIRDAYVNLGFDYDAHHFYALAEAAFLKGLSIAPADGRLHYLLGVTYRTQGKRELALREYRRAIASDEPDVARAASRDIRTFSQT